MAQLTIQQAMDLAWRHHQAGNVQKAETLYRQVLARQPRRGDAMQLLAVLAHQTGRSSLAADLLRQAVSNDPKDAGAFSNLGAVLAESGQLDQAIAAHRRAIALNSRSAETHYNLGKALAAKGEFDQAISAFREAIVLKPDFADAFNGLGNALTESGRVEQAVDAYQRALQLQPSNASAHNNLGVAWNGLGRLDDSVAAFRRAIAINPHLADAYNNLGSALKDLGQLDDSIAAFRRSLECNPDQPAVHSNLVYTLHFHPDYDANALYEEASRWNERHAAPLARSILPSDNDRDPARPLRIGYVSSEFKTHPLAFNFLPLALSHDRANFHIVCYSGVRHEDAMTNRLRGLVKEWRETAKLSDEALADLVRRDRIDILVDLGTHMANNRLLVFARKPAPVQVTMLCSMGTTGLPTIDYRISDRYSDPENFGDAYYVEETIRLPDCYFCHEPPGESPPINTAPVLESNRITFGSLNNFCKVTPSVLKRWSEILAALPESRLLLRCPAGAAQARVLCVMGDRGIGADRIEFLDRRLSTDEYLRLHHRLDIYLDPFPYSGHTTSLDALWMGVPLVTLAGQTDVGRSGVFLLTNLKMEELIAGNEQEYVSKAVELSRDLGRLASYRGGLRDRMLGSPLLDTPKFARNVESAFRRMWEKWCGVAAGRR